ncbi:sensor histidine kinase [Trichlorobacter ammonificans]|uniref:histidine kinase n=1 Tax=Trichlorobacter ammonificans TaxID=2916410 RepID=A0ABM9DBG5_9BACT|nr:cache domain-containing protein [Trichlorobacter ammonificans]CAH2032572.1 Histidine kinase [Trichlorobacter ammonificans]
MTNGQGTDPRLRRRLLLTTLLPLLTALLVGWLLGDRLIAARIAGQAQEEARNDLGTAAELLQGELNRLAEGVQLIGRSPGLARSLADGRTPELARLLDLLSGSRGYSFLSVVDRYGQVRYRSAHPERAGDTLRHLKPVADALAGRPGQGLVLLSPLQAGQENPDLPRQMLVTLQPSPHAPSTTRTAEQRGLFLTAAAPVLGEDGAVSGALFAGLLLNNNERLADRITRLIAPQQREEGLRQSATIFLDDVRIATTVEDEQGRRATGTRLSAEVAATVLQRGERWIAPAYVLKERTFAAYEPLRDPQGNVVGALYVGVPERPYVQLRWTLNLTFAALLLGLTLLAVWLTTGLGRQLAERQREIGALNRTLEEKVRQRTRELEEKNRRLRETEKELARSERLAELGMLSAGVAHEINNPLAIIRGNAELLQMSLPEGSDLQEEVTEILDQSGRINRIVGGLLTLARQDRRQVSRFEAAPLLDEILDRIGHQLPLAGVDVERDYRRTPCLLEGDREQLRQVFTNLILNALEAMEGEGTLSVGADVDPGSTSSITVADSGPGIAPEQRERLFTPFFTTKQNGTGLGLAVSWAIVRNHGGTIDVQSVPGAGARFAVILPSPSS